LFGDERRSFGNAWVREHFEPGALEHVVEALGVGGAQLRCQCWVGDEQVTCDAKLLELGLGARRGFSTVAGEKVRRLESILQVGIVGSKHNKRPVQRISGPLPLPIGPWGPRLILEIQLGFAEPELVRETRAETRA
jgi:hypothetical protein